MKELKSREGYYLTQSAEVANEERTYIIAIKGSDINENDWREATLEEKDSFEKAQKEAVDVEHANYTYEETDDIIVAPSADILRENGDLAEGGNAE